MNSQIWLAGIMMGFENRCLQNWGRAIKPDSWSKILIPAIWGQIYGEAKFRLFPSLIGLLLSLFLTIMIVLLNDVSDEKVDLIKRRMFRDRCGKKTIPDGLIARQKVFLVGLIFAALSMCLALFATIFFELPWLVFLVALAIFLFQMYSFLPLRLNYRGGGEFLEMLGVGLLIPVLNSYCARGEFFPASCNMLCGFMMLALASAIASGLSDEESDRVGGKKTLASIFGNESAKIYCEIFVFVGALCYLRASFITILSFLSIMYCLYKLIFLHQNAKTSAFTKIKEYKIWIHRAIWSSSFLLVLGRIFKV